VNNGDPASQIATTVAIRNDRSTSIRDVALIISNAQIGVIRRQLAERVRDPSETFLSAPTDDVLGVKRSCSSPVWTTQLGAHVPFASKASRPECAKSKPWRIEKMGGPRLVEKFPGSGER
jgi:hypothetical protein